MTDAQLWSQWTLWAVVAGAVVVVAAALLVTILVTAQGILDEAARALEAAEEIRTHTLPIWALDTTNEVAEGILATVQAIEQDGALLVEELEAHTGSGGVL